jgi:hypothetical protein
MLIMTLVLRFYTNYFRHFGRVRPLAVAGRRRYRRQPVFAVGLPIIIIGWLAKTELHPPLRPFWSLQTELTTTAKGQILLRGTGTVILSSVRTAVLDFAHEGHPGIVRMKQRCRETVWNPGIDRDIAEYVRGFTACIVSGKSASPTQGPLQPVALPTGAEKIITRPCWRIHGCTAPPALSDCGCQLFLQVARSWHVRICNNFNRYRFPHSTVRPFWPTKKSQRITVLASLQ